jgi:hypothetical protein
MASGAEGSRTLDLLNAIPVSPRPGCARPFVNSALPAEIDAPSRTAADTQTALLPLYPSYPPNGKVTSIPAKA